MESRLLSFKAETRSLQLVLEPIAEQVAQLEKLISSRKDAPLPDMFPAASAVRVSVYKLHKIATAEVSKSEDMQLKAELPMACDVTVNASEQLVEAACRLREQPSSHPAKSLFIDASQGIRAGIVQVFLCWDNAEVRKILTAAQSALDRLALMNGAKSMRSLVICFRGYADSMKELLNLIDKRQKELIDADKKQRLLVCLDKIKAALPLFSSAMQTYVKSQTPLSKETKQNIYREISTSLASLMDSMKHQGSLSMAREIVEVKKKLETDEKQHFIGPELERHIDTIINNSMAVANVSREDYREVIVRKCKEILALRKELGAHCEALSANPGSVKTKNSVNKCSDKLCENLNELDRWVADSVVDQITNVFVDPCKPLNHLVQVATGDRSYSTGEGSGEGSYSSSHPTATFTQPSFSSASPAKHSSKMTSGGSPRLESDGIVSTSLNDSSLRRHVEVFRSHSRRLSQVATHAAQSSTDTKRMQQIRALASSIDELTSIIVGKAGKVSKNPRDKQAKEELDSLQQEWVSKVQELIHVIDDIIDPEDFMFQSEANIQENINKCKAAIRNRKWEDLCRLVRAIVAKCWRALEVGETAVRRASDHSYKTTLSNAVKRLEKAIHYIDFTASKLMKDSSNQERHGQFFNSTQEFLDCLQSIRSVLGTEIDILSETESEKEEESLPAPQESSTPSNSKRGLSKEAVTVPERMVKRNVHHTKTHPKFIGGLGGKHKHYPQVNDRRDFGGQDQQKHSLSFGSDDQSSKSFDSGTQTPRPSTRDQSSQVDGIVSINAATFGSSQPGSLNLTPNSSTSSWMMPLSPVRKAPLSPARHTHPSPPRYLPSSPSPRPSSSSSHPPSLPSYSPPLTPRQVPHRPAPPSPTEVAMKSYVSPLQKLITAGEKGDQRQVSTHGSNLSARTIRLTKMADSAASTLNKDGDLVKVIQTKSSEINKLTPHILDLAGQLVSKQSQQQQQKEEFQANTYQWAGHVRELIDATQQANLPWSRTTEQLVKAAESGSGLDQQMDHVSTQTRKMIDIGNKTIEAATIEEAIGLTGDPGMSIDKELQQQVKLVKTKISDIQKLTPKLLGAAKMATGQPMGSAASEHLHLLSQEWATKAKTLLKGMDDVTLGMSGAADTLFISAMSGDAGLLTEQTRAIKDYVSSLHSMTNEVMDSCTGTEEVKVVHVIARNIEKLFTQLVECADIVAGAASEEEGEPDQETQEDMELLRRDWSSQVHLLTARIDNLTAEASAPLNRLVDLVLQANRTSGLAKKHLLSKFEEKATFLTDQLERVENLFAAATEKLDRPEPPVRIAEATIRFLRNLTPHAIGAAKSLESEAGSAMLEHFDHLRRQWAAKAQFLLGNLRKIKLVNVDEVIDVFNDLLHDSHDASTTLYKSDESDFSLLSSTSDTLSSMQRSYSSEVIGDLTPRTRFDFDDLELKAPSTPSVELQSKKRQHTPTLSEMGLRHVTPRGKRSLSMKAPLPPWAGENSSFEDTSSSDSIILAAQSLRELTEEFSEESNVIVCVGKKMSEQMSQMAEYTRGKGVLQSKADMISTAKAVAANGQIIAKIVEVISNQCLDTRSKNNLLWCAEKIPTLSKQLTMIASVKTSTPDHISADLALVKNAQNLMQAVIETVQAAEAACMKGLKSMDGSTNGDEYGQLETINLTSWKRKLYHQRVKESVNAPLGSRGLRKLNKYRISTPSVADVIKPSEIDMKSPTKH